MSFARPDLLLLALPWVALWGWFALRQWRAWRWVEARVVPRFRASATAVASRRGLAARLGLLLATGLALVAAAARPEAIGGDLGAGGDDRPIRLVLLVDASASMHAQDAIEGPLPAGPADGPAPRRLEQAKAVAIGLVEALPRAEVGLVSYSGAATLHLPLTRDREALLEALRVLEIHSFYQSTGSSLAGALDAALHFVRPERGGLQLVLLSDGEVPHPDDHQPPLAALAEAGVPVHAAAFGSAEGQGRVIFDFRDIRAGREERRELAEFHTRREEEHLRRIARATGGTFRVAGASAAAELAAAVEAAAPAAERAAAERDPDARHDVSWLPLALFVVLVAGERLAWRPRPADTAFDLSRIGPGRSARAAALVLLGVAVATAGACGGDEPEKLAHRENEAGITADAVGARERARRHYERAIGFGVRPEIPTHNLGRSALLAGDPAEAHDILQRALALAPGLPAALFNDGVALYRWGEAERDPRGCQLERTLELWRAAADRFAAAARPAPGGAAERDRSIEASAAADLAFVRERIAELEALVADPPPECLAPPPPSGGAQPPPPDGGDPPPPGAGGQPPPPAGENGEPPPPEGDDDAPPPPPAGGGGGLGAAELAEIEQALARIREELADEGRYFRRTLPEQFPPEAWEEPEEEIWW